MSQPDVRTQFAVKIGAARTALSAAQLRITEAYELLDSNDSECLRVCGIAGVLDQLANDLDRAERRALEAAGQPAREATLRGRTDAANRSYWEQRTEEQAP